MKIRKTILTAAILMAAVCLPAQNKSAGINISIWKDICTQPHDSMTRTNAHITHESIAAFIETLDVAEAVKD